MDFLSNGTTAAIWVSGSEIYGTGGGRWDVNQGGKQCVKRGSIFGFSSQGGHIWLSGGVSLA
jgi:hypothetical protein